MPKRLKFLAKLQNNAGVFLALAVNGCADSACQRPCQPQIAAHAEVCGGAQAQPGGCAGFALCLRDIIVPYRKLYDGTLITATGQSLSKRLLQRCLKTLRIPYLKQRKKIPTSCKALISLPTFARNSRGNNLFPPPPFIRTPCGHKLFSGKLKTSETDSEIGCGGSWEALRQGS